MNQVYSTISFTPYSFDDSTELMSDEVNDEPQTTNHHEEEEEEEFLEEEFELYLSSHLKNFENEKTTKNETISYEPTNPFINQITFKLPCPSLFVSFEEDCFNEKKRKFEQTEKMQKKRKYETNQHCFAGNFDSFEHFFQGLDVNLEFNQIF
jgi:hypothetical protein